MADPEMLGRERRPQAVHPARGWDASGQDVRDMSSGGVPHVKVPAKCLRCLM